MTLRERLGLAGMLVVGGAALAVAMLQRPLLEPVFALDSDGDGLTNAFENRYGTNPYAADTDGDTWSDWDEIFVHGTDPRSADTDNDGTADNLDATPLDDGTDADGRTAATGSWAENLTAPAWTGTSAVDGKGVYPHSGEFQHSLDLLEIDPGYGPSMDLTIHYRSGITYDGPVGKNWSWLPGLAPQGNNDVYYYPGDGRRILYDWINDEPPYFDAADEALPGWYLMVKNQDGTYSLTHRDGTVQAFSTTGAIMSVTDRFGNAVTYAYTNGKVSSITDATGHVVTVTWYAGTNRVQYVGDSSNRTAVLTYNCRGELAKVRTPTSAEFPGGRYHQFVYSTGSQVGTLNVNMVRAIDPKGQVWLRNEFDEDDRTAKQYLGYDYFTFTYNGITSVTTVYDREGNQREWYVPSALPGWLKEYSNRDVRAGDPSYWQTSFSHNSMKLRTKVVFPEGNRVDTDYDASGNVTEVRRKATDTDTDDDDDDLYETFTYDATYNLMTSRTDARGNTTDYTLEDSGALTDKVVETITYPTVTYLDPDQTAVVALTWNSHGQLVTATDGEGYERKDVYFADEGEQGVKKGYLKKRIVDSAQGGLQLTTQYGYRDWGDRNSVTNPRGKTTSLTVNEYGWVTKRQSTAPQSYEVCYTFDANGNVTQRDVENVDKNNARDAGNPWFTTTWSYDILDLVTMRVEEVGAGLMRTWRYDYTKNGRTNTLTKPEGNMVRYVYDERDLLYQRIRGFDTADASTDTRTYDGNRNLTLWTNALDNDWVFAYDAFDRQEYATNPLGHYAQRIHDKAGNVTEVKRWEEAGANDVLVAHTKQSFDERGRLHKVERGLKEGANWSWLATTLTLDKRSLVTAAKDPRDKETSFAYDHAGRRTLVTDPLGNTVEYTLDANGNPTVVEETEATGYGTPKTFVTEIDYDELDRRKEVRVVDETDPDEEHPTTFKHDSLSVLVERVDAESNTTTWTHDGLGRVLEESIALGGGAYKKRSWGYDDNGRLFSHKDDALNETTWGWNARDLCTTETYADDGVKTFGYDAADNLTDWEDPNGTTVEVTYDYNNRKTNVDVTRAQGVGGTTAEYWYYDALDRVVEAKDDDVTVQWAWDSLGRRVSETSGPNPISTYGKTTYYVLDAAGNATRVNYPDGSFSAKRTFDDANRLTLVEDASDVDIVAPEYFGAGGRLKKLTFGNGTCGEQGYDGFRRLTDLDHKTSGAQLLACFDMAYDRVGNMLYEEWGHDSGKGHNYAYDKAYRLTKTLQGCADPSAEQADPGSETYVKKIEYNLTDDSDRDSVVETPYGQQGETTDYTSNEVHEYTAVGGTNRDHDANGNLIDDGTLTFQYDYRNNLIKATRISDSTVLGEYQHDPVGRRTKKILQGNASIRFYHDGLHEIEEFDGSGNVLRKYVYRLDIDSIAMMESADVADVDNDQNTSELVRLYYHVDGRTNVSRLTGPAQTVVECYESDPYGNVTIKDKNGDTTSTSQVGNFLVFQRRRNDVENGLLYFRARTYDPSAGYWLQRDPLGFVDTANFREFESSCPTGNVDPLGLDGTAGHEKGAREAAAAWGATSGAGDEFAEADSAEDSNQRKDEGWAHSEENCGGTGSHDSAGEDHDRKTQKANRDNFIETAVRAAKAGNYGLAYRLLGAVAHWSQDLPWHYWMCILCEHPGGGFGGSDKGSVFSTSNLWTSYCENFNRGPDDDAESKGRALDVLREFQAKLSDPVVLAKMKAWTPKK